MHTRDFLPLIRFNPRVLAGGRDERGTAGHTPRGVSIHASSREDATYQIDVCEALGGFNPRVLAGGRDYVAERIVELEQVSIHASSREDATCNRERVRVYLYVSIHASSREDATSVSLSVGAIPEFQSTRPRGRTRRPASLSLRYWSQFQSTRPRGRTRQVCRNGNAVSKCFNPRVLAGGRDQFAFETHLPYAVSIHASSREDATQRGIHSHFGNGFQSTRPRGRTRLRCLL